MQPAGPAIPASRRKYHYYDRRAHLHSTAEVPFRRKEARNGFIEHALLKERPVWHMRQRNMLCIELYNHGARSEHCPLSGGRL